jgi:hypothetical protein
MAFEKSEEQRKDQRLRWNAVNQEVLMSNGEFGLIKYQS